MKTIVRIEKVGAEDSPRWGLYFNRLEIASVTRLGVSYWISIRAGSYEPEELRAVADAIDGIRRR